MAKTSNYSSKKEYDCTLEIFSKDNVKVAKASFVLTDVPHNAITEEVKKDIADYLFHKIKKRVDFLSFVYGHEVLTIKEL